MFSRRINMLRSHFEDVNLSGIDDENKDRKTPLIIAIENAREESIDLIQFLIEHTANVLKKDKFDNNIWHHLCLNEDLNEVDLETVTNMLMSHFEDVNLSGIDDENDNGETPLMIALKKPRIKSIDLIQFLIEHGANVLKKDKFDNNIWHHLCLNEYLDKYILNKVTNMLRSHFEDVNLSGIDDENKDRKTPLMIAIEKASWKSIDLIQFLIEHTANVLKKDKFDNNIWHHLCLNRHLDKYILYKVTNMLRSHFEDVNLSGIDDENKDRKTPLMIAIEKATYKSMDLIQFLIEHTANVLKKDKFDNNIWHHFCLNEDLDEVDLETVTNMLMSHFEDVNLSGIDDENKDRKTPLMIAIEKATYKSMDLIQFLIEHTANVLKKDKFDNNIWHHFCLNEDLDEVDLETVTNMLMSHFEDVNLSGIDDDNKDRKTPLMIAIEKARDESIDLIQFLIEHIKCSQEG
ncbi:transient receptor potential cation channel subfamily A member 1 homolog isoform X2 [Aethina tumida]|uniref:transient receptor potential cation channel subfamily A member 1 homolog isoform X2 n=1 Tax=Aethina tumida TaxID=116153 RepID=UPI0021480D7B|nr:transient receptor potential cation channel subfamily A member 1 homolog isoform X2 [Aethina tumida]